MNFKFSKNLKILFVFELILLILIAALFLTDNQKIPTAYAVKEITSAEKTDFKVLTKAVCENKSDHIFCRDELFVSCNGKEYIVSENKSNDFIECDNIKIKLSDISNDTTKLKKGWINFEK